MSDQIAKPIAVHRTTSNSGGCLDVLYDNGELWVHASYGPPGCRPTWMKQELPHVLSVVASDNQRILTCVYCGYEYPAGTPPHGNELLTAHIAVCDKHPMKAVIEDRDRLLAACQAVVEASLQCSGDLKFGELVSELAMGKIGDAIAKTTGPVRTLP